MTHITDKLGNMLAEEPTTLRKAFDAATDRRKARRDHLLFFDGKGINGPDEYRSRVATLTNPNDSKQQMYGHVMACGPELLERLRGYVERAERRHAKQFERPAITNEEILKREYITRQLAMDKALIRRAEGFHEPVGVSAHEARQNRKPTRVGGR